MHRQSTGFVQHLFSSAFLVLLALQCTTAAQTVKMATTKLTATPASVRSGGQVTLSWSSTNASSCTGANFATGGAVSGTVKVNPTAMTTYTVNCGGAAAGANGEDDDCQVDGDACQCAQRGTGDAVLEQYQCQQLYGGELCHRGCGQRDGEVEPDGDDHLYGELRRGGGLANGEAGDCQADGGACQCTQRGAGDVVLVQYQYQQLYGGARSAGREVDARAD